MLNSWTNRVGLESVVVGFAGRSMMSSLTVSSPQQQKQQSLPEL